MSSSQRSLIVLNVIGGMAVLASYAWSFGESAALRADLWGGVPRALRPVYTANMLLAAAGYFPFTWLFVLGTSRDGLARGARAPHGALLVLYALVLIPSALWLPLTAAMIESPATLTWVGIRVVLALVGIGAAGLLLLALRLARARGDLTGWLGFAGTLPFFTQTAILDALVWPAYFPA